MIQTTDRQTVRQTERKTGYLRLTIFTAAFVEWELIRPEMVASTTRPKAPEPSTWPENREADGVFVMIRWLSHLNSNCNWLQSLKVSNIVFRCETIKSKCEFQLWYKRIWLRIQFLYTVVPFFSQAQVWLDSIGVGLVKLPDDFSGNQSSALCSKCSWELWIYSAAWGRSEKDLKHNLPEEISVYNQETPSWMAQNPQLHHHHLHTEWR